MVSYILGEYLAAKGRLSRQQLQEIWKAQDEVRVKLGLIAVSEGMLTVEQADEINRLQAVQDKRFGDIAKEKGYLTEEQLNKLLALQGNEYLSFIQSLVNANLFSMETADKILWEYCRDNGFSLSQMEALKNGDTDSILPLYLPSGGSAHQEIIGIAIRTIIRCIDRHVSIEKAQIVSGMEQTAAVLQKLTGQSPLTTGFLEGDTGLLSLASVFGREEFSQLDEDALDSAGEFLNCVNGLYAAAMSEQGITLELTPPDYYADGTALTGDTICLVPLRIENKKLYFVIMEN